MHVLDTSAFIKLLLPEQHYDALRSYLGDGTPRVASSLLRVETLRAAGRVAPSLRREAERQLATLQLVPIDDAVLRIAADVAPPALRSLDALHLATALSLGDLVTSFVTYDRQLGAAAAAAGLMVTAPGVDA